MPLPDRLRDFMDTALLTRSEAIRARLLQLRDSL
jgi:hypothetical protein